MSRFDFMITIPTIVLAGLATVLIVQAIWIGAERYEIRGLNAGLRSKDEYYKQYEDRAARQYGELGKILEEHVKTLECARNDIVAKFEQITNLQGELAESRRRCETQEALLGELRRSTQELILLSDDKSQLIARLTDTVNQFRGFAGTLSPAFERIIRQHGLDDSDGDSASDCCVSDNRGACTSRRDQES